MELRYLERRSSDIRRETVIAQHGNNGQSVRHRSTSPVPRHRTDRGGYGPGLATVVPSIGGDARGHRSGRRSSMDPRSSWPQRSSSTERLFRAASDSVEHRGRHFGMHGAGRVQQQRAQGFDVESDGGVGGRGSGDAAGSEEVARAAASKVRDGMEYIERGARGPVEYMGPCVMMWRYAWRLKLLLWLGVCSGDDAFVTLLSGDLGGVVLRRTSGRRNGQIHRVAWNQPR